MDSKHLPEDEALRIVLVGKTGVGKTATMNTLLGRPGLTKMSASSVTTECEIQRNEKLVVIDTPGVCHTELTERQLRTKFLQVMTYAAPGPHAIVYVLKLRRLTQEDDKTKEVIQSIFGEGSKDYTLVLYTCGDGKIPQESNHKEHRKEFGDRYLIFDNTTKSTNQVSELREMIDKMVKENSEKKASPYYTNEMFKKAQEVIGQEKAKQGVTSTDTPPQEVLDGAVDVLLELTMGEPLKKVVTGILGYVEEKVGNCVTH